MSTPRVILSLIALLFSGAVLSWCLLAPPLTIKSGKQVAKSEKEPHLAPPGMTWIPGGKFLMGSRDGQDDEKPVHETELSGYWIDTTEVTNAEFRRFVDATGYVTLAEKTPTREDFAGVVDTSLITDEDLVAGSICFNPNFDRELVRRIRHPSNPDWAHAVWRIQEGANWRHPHGPDSNIDEMLDHPVVHIAWPDACAYCQWAGKRLPTEAEFEFAARGGRHQQEYPWGNELQDGDRWRANLWQGEFPEEHDVQDGFRFTSAVKSFPPNGYGLYDIVGNVWEWCSDWYQPAYYSDSPRRNPHGPRDSLDPNEPKIPKRVQRGGSFMCNDNYCRGYRCATRMKGDVNSSSFHCGFRSALSPSDFDAFAKAPAQQSATTR